jgi:uncharacterized protein YoxC
MTSMSFFDRFRTPRSITLASIETALAEILRRVKTMASQLTQLQTDVAANATVVGSAVTLLQGLSQQIRDLQNDPVALAQLATDLEAQSKALADAVAANTPATT